MDIGVPELIVILVIVVLLWGPGRLAKIGGELGHGIHAFREGLSSPDKEEEVPPHEPDQAPTAMVNSQENK